MLKNVQHNLKIRKNGTTRLCQKKEKTARNTQFFLLCQPWMLIFRREIEKKTQIEESGWFTFDISLK